MTLSSRKPLAINSDRTAPQEQSGLGPYCLRYRQTSEYAGEATEVTCCGLHVMVGIL